MASLPPRYPGPAPERQYLRYMRVGMSFNEQHMQQAASQPLQPTDSSVAGNTTGPTPPPSYSLYSTCTVGTLGEYIRNGDHPSVYDNVIFGNLRRTINLGRNARLVFHGRQAVAGEFPLPPPYSRSPPPPYELSERARQQPRKGHRRASRSYHNLQALGQMARSDQHHVSDISNMSDRHDALRYRTVSPIARPAPHGAVESISTTSSVVARGRSAAQVAIELREPTRVYEGVFESIRRRESEGGA